MTVIVLTPTLLTIEPDHQAFVVVYSLMRGNPFRTNLEFLQFCRECFSSVEKKFQKKTYILNPFPNVTLGYHSKTFYPRGLPFSLGASSPHICSTSQSIPIRPGQVQHSRTTSNGITVLVCAVADLRIAHKIKSTSTQRANRWDHHHRTSSIHTIKSDNQPDGLPLLLALPSSYSHISRELTSSTALCAISAQAELPPTKSNPASERYFPAPKKRRLLHVLLLLFSGFFFHGPSAIPTHFLCFLMCWVGFGWYRVAR